MEPKILFMGKNDEYLEIRVEREQFEKMINPKEKVDKYIVKRFVKNLELGSRVISAKNLEIYLRTNAMPIRTKINPNGKLFDGNALVEGFLDFFNVALNYAKVYAGRMSNGRVYKVPYVLVDNRTMNIYKITEKGKTIYEVNSLAQLLRE